MSRKYGALIGLPLVALCLTACVGEATGGDVVDAAEETFIDVTTPQGAVPEFVGALEDSTTDRCEPAGEGWVSEGTVTNPTNSPQSYRLYVAFNENRDTRGLIQIDLNAVAAGASESWQAEAPIIGENLSCVLRVERFDPQ